MTTDAEARHARLEEDLVIEVISLPFVVAAATPPVHTGAMIALVPHLEDVLELAQPNGEPISEFHTTILFLGEADGWDDDERDAIHAAVQDLAMRQPMVIAKLFGFSIWNPDTEDVCLVADVGGADLQDVYDSILEELDEIELVYPEQHTPWRPHITLAYGANTIPEELYDKVGPLTYDRIRVAFGGVVTDYPFGGGTLTAALEHVFHLPGKHDQSSHGRGGATDTDVDAARQLNRGKKLDRRDPAQAQIGTAIDKWSAGGNDNAQIRYEMQQAVADPHAPTEGAALMRTVAAAPPDAPTLHRGLVGVHPDDVPKEGQIFELGPTSFTRSTSVRDRFTEHTDSDFGRATSVEIRLKKGSRSLKIDHEVSKGSFKDEKEHLSMGKYRVTSSRQRTVTVKAKNGKKKEITLFEVDIEQVPDVAEVTTHTNVQPVYMEGW